MDDHEGQPAPLGQPAGDGSPQDTAGTAAATPAASPAPAPKPGPARPKPGPAKTAGAKTAGARPAGTRSAGAKTPAKPAPAKKSAARTSTAKPAPPDRKAAARTSPSKKAAPAAVQPAPAAVQPAAAVVQPVPAAEPLQRPTGPAEANSEQELAGQDDTIVDEKQDADLSTDGDQSIGAVAAFAQSVRAGQPPTPEVSSPVVAEPASAEDVEKAWTDNRLAQVLYHDWEAGTYDEKWSISFDERCITYARDRFSALLGADVLRAEAWPYAKALEIGAGTGFFSLNLKQAGVLDEVHVSDVSGGMVESAQRNARSLGFEVTGTVSGAESLPYEDGTFDIVVGHAVIHHIPDVEPALREVLRVLRPGGRFVIAGEPTRIGDWYARQLGRATWELTTRVTKLKPLRTRWARSKEELDASSRAAALEAVVDLHTFVPDELAAMARRAGASSVHTQTEELLAAFAGWPIRTFEAAVNPERLGLRWSMFAYRSWQRLSAVDRVLSRAVPQKLFYNVGITGTKPASSSRLTRLA